MTSHSLFGAMPRSVAEDILEFAHTTDKAVYRTALDAVASARKLRSVFLERQPKAERYGTMIASLSRPAMEAAADALIRNWLLKKHSALLIDFMDALKIQHEKGVVSELPGTVDDALLRNAVESILTRHPADVVSVYLRAFNGMNSENWANLESILATDTRLQWSAPAPA